MRILIVFALLFTIGHDVGAESICKKPPMKLKGSAYDMTYKTLCYKDPSDPKQKCFGVSPDFGYAAVCALGSGMCGVDRKLHKETTFAGRLIPIVLKAFPFLGGVKQTSLTCALVQQACCRAGSDSLNKADSIISFVVQENLGEMKKVATTLDEIGDKAVEIIAEKGREMLDKHKFMKTMLNWYDKVINLGKAAGNKKLRNSTDFGQQLQDYSGFVQDVLSTNEIPDDICDSLLEKIKTEPYSKDEQYVDTVKGICGDGSLDLKAPGKCLLSKTDVASPFICAFGADMCKIPGNSGDKHHVLKIAVHLVGLVGKIIPGFQSIVNNGYTCAVVENACCRAANYSEQMGGKYGKFKLINRILDEAFDGDTSEIIEAVDKVTNKVVKKLETMAGNMWKAVRRWLSSVGKNISDAWCKFWKCEDKE